MRGTESASGNPPPCGPRKPRPAAKPGAAIRPRIRALSLSKSKGKGSNPGPDCAPRLGRGPWLFGAGRLGVPGGRFCTPENGHLSKLGLNYCLKATIEANFKKECFAPRCEALSLGPCRAPALSGSRGGLWGDINSYTTHETRHTTHETRHTTHDTRHTTTSAFTSTSTSTSTFQSKCISAVTATATATAIAIAAATATGAGRGPSTATATATATAIFPAPAGFPSCREPGPELVSHLQTT